ncbi:MAG TPA: protein kinase [Gemmatimonadales bacterium]|nr:protein kinase [Gemmatimonadales bacterium]
MPYVEGESLRDKLVREKQLGIEGAVAIARAVAAALEFAHRHGVVHRDIKPENVLLQAGQALVADFGIALAVSQAGGSRMTETGMSLGTPHYMSPEQATGDRTLDARSDIYALGCITYEMLAGEPPYLGNTAQAIVAKILTETPTPVRKRRESVPRHVEAAIQMALAKLPADRFATAAEFGAALVNPGFTLSGTMAQAGAAPSDGRWKRRAQVGFGVAGLLAAATGYLLLRRPAPHEAPVIRVSMLLPRGEELRSGPYLRFAISPDGRALAYISSSGGTTSRLLLRILDQLHATPIPETQRPQTPFFSPDGKSLAFYAGSTEPITLKVVSLTGAPPATVLDSGLTGGVGGDWGADGYLYVSAVSGLARVPASGGPAEPLTKLDRAAGDIYHGWPQLLPTRDGVVFTVIRGNNREIAVLDLKTRAVRVLLAGTMPRYLPTGHLVYLRNDGTLLAVRFDPARRQVTGAPVAVVEGMAVRTYGVGDYVISSQGTLVYSGGGAGGGGVEFLNWVTRDGKPTQVDSSWTSDFITHALSPDGKRLVVSMVSEGPRDLWIKELDRGPLTRFTFEGQTNQRPTWSPDGNSITFISDRSGTSQLYRQPAGGSGTAELLTPKHEQRPIAEGFWSPDGKWLIYRTESSSGGSGDIMGFRPGIDTMPVPLVATRFAETAPGLSPDGKWLAYTSLESNQTDVFVRPFPKVDDGKWQVSVGGGREPVWAHNGHELFYKSNDDQMMVASLDLERGFGVRDRKQLFSTGDFDNDPEHARYNLSPDDQRFIMSRRGTGSGGEIVLVLHWFEELEARMGAKQ